MPDGICFKPPEASSLPQVLDHAGWSGAIVIWCIFASDKSCGPNWTDTICTGVPECTASGGKLAPQPPRDPDRYRPHCDDLLIRGEFGLDFDENS